MRRLDETTYRSGGSGDNWHTTWAQDSRAYQPQMLPQWIAADGKSFWLAFTDFQVRDGKRPCYCSSCQKVEIRTD